MTGRWIRSSRYRAVTPYLKTEHSPSTRPGVQSTVRLHPSSTSPTSPASSASCSADQKRRLDDRPMLNTEGRHERWFGTHYRQATLKVHNNHHIPTPSGLDSVAAVLPPIAVPPLSSLLCVPAERLCQRLHAVATPPEQRRPAGEQCQSPLPPSALLGTTNNTTKAPHVDGSVASSGSDHFAVSEPYGGM